MIEDLRKLGTRYSTWKGHLTHPGERFVTDGGSLFALEHVDPRRLGYLGGAPTGMVRIATMEACQKIMDTTLRHADTEGEWLGIWDAHRITVAVMGRHPNALADAHKLKIARLVTGFDNVRYSTEQRSHAVPVYPIALFKGDTFVGVITQLRQRTPLPSEVRDLMSE